LNKSERLSANHQLQNPSARFGRELQAPALLKGSSVTPDRLVGN